MSEPFNPLESEFEARPMSAFDVWILAITKPYEETFEKIVSQSDVSTGKAFVWVFLATFLSGAVGTATQSVAIRNLLQNLPADVTGGVPIPAEALGSFSVGQLLCGVPFAAFFGVLFFALMVGLIQWVAKLMGGIGNFEKLVYAFAAIALPAAVVSMVLSLLSLIPFIGFLFGIMALVFTLYVLVLQLTAVKAVNQLSWGKAIGAYLLPVASIIFFLCCCILLGSAAMFAALQEALNSSGF